MATKKRAAAGAGPIFPHKRRNTETDQIEQVGWCAMLDLGSSTASAGAGPSAAGPSLSASG